MYLEIIYLRVSNPCQIPYIIFMILYLGIPLLTRLRLGLSHLNENRFNHNFDNCLHPLHMYLHTRDWVNYALFSIYIVISTGISEKPLMTLMWLISVFQICTSILYGNINIYFYMKNQVLITSRIRRFWQHLSNIL